MQTKFNWENIGGNHFTCNLARSNYWIAFHTWKVSTGYILALADLNSLEQQQIECLDLPHVETVIENYLQHLDSIEITSAKEKALIVSSQSISQLFSQQTISVRQPINDNNLLAASTDVEALATWLNEYKNSKNTIIAYRQCVERFYMWIYQLQKSLKDVNREDVQNYQDFLADPQPAHIWCGQKASRATGMWKPFVKCLSNSSITHQFQILKNLYTYLQNAGYLSRNPFSLIKAKRKHNKPDIERVLDVKAIKYVLDYLENIASEDHNQEAEKEQAIWLIKLFFLTGMRISEVAQSRMNHFIHKRDKWWLKVVGKGEKYAEIVITQELMEALLRYRLFIGIKDAYPNLAEDYPTVFCSRGDITKGLSANMLHRIIKRIFNSAAEYTEQFDTAAAYAIASASAHWLRHASATAQLDAGISLESVKDNLRHESVETTMRYVHKNKDDRHDETTTKFKI